MNLAYARVPVVYRVNQVHIRVAALQEYVNTYSTHRVQTCVASAYSLPSPRHLVTQGLLPREAALGGGFSLLVPSARGWSSISVTHRALLGLKVPCAPK